jgi:cell division septum initiation protein DivIVA
MTSEAELEYQQKILKLLRRIAELEAQVAELTSAHVTTR